MGIQSKYVSNYGSKFEREMLLQIIGLHNAAQLIHHHRELKVEEFKMAVIQNFWKWENDSVTPYSMWKIQGLKKRMSTCRWCALLK